MTVFISLSLEFLYLFIKMKYNSYGKIIISIFYVVIVAVAAVVAC